MKTCELNRPTTPRTHLARSCEEERHGKKHEITNQRIPELSGDAPEPEFCSRRRFHTSIDHVGSDVPTGDECMSFGIESETTKRLDRTTQTCLPWLVNFQYLVCGGRRSKAAISGDTTNASTLSIWGDWDSVGVSCIALCRFSNAARWG